MEQQVLLQAADVVKVFHTTEPPTRGLNGIELTVRQGEFVAVMGASGSGKSTLLYSISGMDRPTSGQVLLQGRDLTALNDTEMSTVRLTTMGFVFQQPHFLQHLTIRDNILLPALKAASRERKAAAVAHVDRLLERFEIAHLADRGITQVSGGQLQRASIVRALAAQPSVVFADEPTGALNSSMTTEVMDALSEVHREGTAVVMVTHDPGCAVRADRVVYLHDGDLVDACVLGTWTEGEATGREAELLAWLRGLGF